MNIKLGLFMTFATMSILVRAGIIKNLVQGQKERVEQQSDHLFQQEVKNGRQAFEQEVKNKKRELRGSAFVDAILACMKENEVKNQNIAKYCSDELYEEYHEGERRDDFSNIIELISVMATFDDFLLKPH